MSRVGNTMKQIANHDTRMGHYMQDLQKILDPDALSSYGFIDKAYLVAHMTMAVSGLAIDEHDRIVGLMNPVNINIWSDQHNSSDRINGNIVWSEPPNIDCVMDEEAYDAKDALTHITAIRRVFCNGPEVYASVRRVAAIDKHDTMFFMDMVPSTLHDLVNRAWHNAGCGRDLDRLILEKHIFTNLMNDFQKKRDRALNKILLQVDDKELNAFVTKLPNTFRG